jgi:hypothetical protein
MISTHNHLTNTDGTLGQAQQGTQGIAHVANHIWDTNSMSWVKDEGGGGGGGASGDVNVLSSALPTGAATSAKQDTANTSLSSIDSTLTDVLAELQTEYALQMITVGSITYIGRAAIGSSGASAVWQVQKIDETSGLIITWADGNSNFDNIFNNYASLSYS